MTEEKLPDIEVELPKLPPMGYGNDGYSVQAMHEYAVEYAYKFARQAILAERERLALQWDGCMCDAVGGEIDVGAAIRNGQ